MSIEKQAIAAKEASIMLSAASTQEKNNVLKEIAIAISKNRVRILAENKKDIAEAEKNNLSMVLIKRLKLDDAKINEMISGIKDVIKLEDPAGKTMNSMELDKGLELFQVTCPIGVIGIIFEARPDALVQISCLCIKSGNAAILKGGSEAKNSNRILAEIISNAADKLAKGSVQLIETREDVNKMLKMDKYIDLLVPRGSGKFVKYIQENTKIPVLGHSEGICHVYVDKDADIAKALVVSFDAKCQYPAVCNAMETLLVHKDIAKAFLPKMIKMFRQARVELRGDESIRKIVDMKKATEQDWATEYNDLILSIKVVNGLDEAINHINRYGSKHTDAIVTESSKDAKKFIRLVDASSVMWNASTRFADGYRYGKGAEVGISTAKIHARGPVGLEGLVIYKYIVVGKGHKVANYSGRSAKKFTHRRLDKKWQGK